MSQRGGRTNQLRVIGGQWRGRRLAFPDLPGLRPTPDRVRETLFNWLAPILPGARCLDLFAGSGALGIEALSRGASACLFVEDAAEARGIIRDNIEAFGLTGIAKIFRRDATNLGDVGTMQPYDIVFADPPYAKQLGEKAIVSALAGGWLSPGARIVLEESASAPFEVPQGFALADERTYGETLIRFLDLA